MGITNRFRAFLSMDIQKKLLLLEAFFYLGWARILLMVPFSKVAPSLGVQMLETSTAVDTANRTVLLSVHEAINIMSNHTFWESKCLVKAIAGMKMLNKRRMDSTLYLGTAKDEHGKMIAHAWLRSGSYYITGAEGREKFTVVGKFGRQIVNRDKGGNYE